MLRRLGHGGRSCLATATLVPSGHYRRSHLQTATGDQLLGGGSPHRLSAPREQEQYPCSALSVTATPFCCETLRFASTKKNNKKNKSGNSNSNGGNKEQQLKKEEGDVAVPMQASADATSGQVPAQEGESKGDTSTERERSLGEKADDEIAAKKKADEEAAAKKKADEEAAAKKKADDEIAAKKKADDEAASSTTEEGSKTEGASETPAQAEKAPEPADAVNGSTTTTAASSSSNQQEETTAGQSAAIPPPGPGDKEGLGKKKKAFHLLGRDVPQGFEAAYQFPFVRPGSSPLRVAIQPTMQERIIIDRNEAFHSAKRRQRRIFIAIALWLAAGWYYDIPNRLGITRYLASLGLGVTSEGDTTAEEEALSTAEAGSLEAIAKALQSIWVNFEKHRASYLDAKGNTLATVNYVEFNSFEQRSLAEEVTKEVPMYLSVPTYFPWLPMGLLLLIPCLAFFHDSFSLASKAANKAVNTIGRGGGDKKFKFQTERNVKTKLGDVAGLTEAKHEIVEIIDFLKKPQRYTSLGARLPKGVLLDGPPGVGKTLIAKAVAGEAMVPFVSCSGSEFDEVFVGVGAARVRELFKESRKHSPCVVFIDEIDAFGKKRQTDGRGGSRGTLNALLSELDGFKEATGIIVLAATNRADILDNALTRSGRFDRKISLEKPPHKDRIQIARVHLKPLLLDPSLDLDSASEQLASLTPGCSGADIYNICNEAAIIASRDGRENVNMACFHKALERVLVGMTKKSKKFSEPEKQRLAYHEAGHVVLQWFQTMTDPVVKASIVPRGGDKVGVTQKLPTDKFIVIQEELHQRMVSRLGGYVSEELFFQDLSTSASDDLKAVTEMAWNEVVTYGMDPQNVGHVHYETNDSAIAKPFGPRKEDEIDEAVSRLVTSALKTARELLKKHLVNVKTVGGMLAKEETITAHELWRLLGERPVMSADFRKFLESRH